MLETKRAKLMVAVVATLLFAAFQMALQATPAHAYEVHVSIKGAGTVDEDPALTQANILNPACSSSSTTPTGVVGANCYPGDPNGDYQWGWTVQWKATPAAGYRFVQWESDGNPKPVICDKSSPPATTSTYTGTSCKFETYDNLQTRAVFVDDTSPTMASLTGPSGTIGGAATFNFSASSDPTFRYFECRVAGVHDWQTCTSPKTEDPTASGTYTFDVRAVDWSNNKSSISSLSWTVDKTLPSVSINSGPLQGTTVNNNSATFGFTSSEPSTFQCKLDGGNFGTCTGSNSQSYSGLSQGSHTFSVRAIDQVGNIGNAASRTWTIDTVAPETTLDPNVGPSPDSTTQDNDPVFQFSSNETGATFECNLTGPGLTSNTFTACNASPGTSPGTFTKSYTNLKDGTYTFKVRAKDQANNVDPTIDDTTRSWTINSTPTVLSDSLTPLKAATGVSRTTNVSASFSEEMAPTSIANLTTHVSKTFKLQMYNKKKKKWIAVPATVDVTNSNTTAILDPYGATEGSTEKPLAARKKFRATITTGVTDAQGNPIAKNFVWTFNTGSI